MSTVTTDPYIDFTIGKHHKNFRGLLEKELFALDVLRLEYNIRERQDVLLPKLTIDGRAVAGLQDIKDFLWEIMTEYVGRLK